MDCKPLLALNCVVFGLVCLILGVASKPVTSGNPNQDPALIDVEKFGGGHGGGGGAHGGGAAGEAGGGGTVGGGGAAAGEAGRAAGDAGSNGFAGAEHGGPGEILASDGQAYLPPLGSDNRALANGEPPPKGYLFVPKGSLEGAGAPHVDPRNDPPDTLINQPFHWFIVPGHPKKGRIHNLNPCEWYKENLDSIRNGKRQTGCEHEVKHLKTNIKKRPSSNCPNPTKGRCFQIAGQAGRCYVLISNQNMKKWVVIESCKQS